MVDRYRKNSLKGLWQVETMKRPLSLNFYVNKYCSVYLDDTKICFGVTMR